MAVWMSEIYGAAFRHRPAVSSHHGQGEVPPHLRSSLTCEVKGNQDTCIFGYFAGCCELINFCLATVHMRSAGDVTWSSGGAAAPPRSEVIDKEHLTHQPAYRCASLDMMYRCLPAETLGN